MSMELVLEVTKKLGLAAPYELLFIVPNRYLDYRVVTSKDVFDQRVALAQAAALKVRAIDAIDIDRVRYRNTFRAVALGPNERMFVTKWGMAFGQWQNIKNGTTLYLYGKLGMFSRQISFTASEIIPEHQIGKVLPVYTNLRKKIAKSKVFHAIQYAAQNESFLDLAAKRVYNESGGQFPTDVIRSTLRKLHCPTTPEEGREALHQVRKFAVSAVARQLKAMHQKSPESVLTIEPQAVEGTIASIPFPLSASQKKAIAAICKDLSDDYPARHLVSGDVGSGKSVTYLVPAVAAIKSGYRAAVVAPNLLLANQIAHEARTYWPDVPIKVVTGATKKTEVAKDDPALVIGTSAVLFRAAKSGYFPHVLVLDEQQKMSKAQRDALVAPYTNVIEATATCLPRTAALIKLGAWRASRIYPHAKKEITTELYFTENRRELFEELAKIVARGARIAVVYPLVAETPEEEEEVANLSSKKYTAESAYEMWEKIFPGEVVLLHGKMSDEEKIEALAQAKDKKRVIVTTTVLEIGITIPRLEAMVVVEPYRYGLSTLHQLRGRLVRHGGQGLFAMYCPFPKPQHEIALLDDKAFESDLDEDEIDEDVEEKRRRFVQRLEVLKTETDGHKIAEIDLKLRGFGDLTLNTDAQSGVSKSTLFYGIKFTQNDFTQNDFKDALAQEDEEENEEDAEDEPSMSW